jgi:hypothetical protein
MYGFLDVHPGSIFIPNTVFHRFLAAKYNLSPNNVSDHRSRKYLSLRLHAQCHLPLTFHIITSAGMVS